jgi:hypothetical protein
MKDEPRLTLSEPVPRLRAPIAIVVEAGLGQCIAQMVAARDFNTRSRAATAIPGDVEQI